MNRHVIENSLRNAARKWRLLKFLRQTALLGSIASGVMLLLGGAAWLGWIHQPSAFWGAIALLLPVFLIVWLWQALTTGRKLNLNFLATRIEAAQPRLQDRLNTLVHLNQKRGDRAWSLFYERIWNQADIVMGSEPPEVRYPGRPLLIQVAIFLITLSATIVFYLRVDPCALLAKTEPETPVVPVIEEPPPATEQPAKNLAEEKTKWGEVLIVDPAKDLQVTKVDVVPLQIEAAASDPLLKVGWMTGINGGAERSHELPPPAEPRYAVYKPVMYLDEFNLSDWDVMTYYAKADTEGSNSHASQVYFLEVRPFREDILKIPGGADGKPYEMMSELTSLIEQQEQVMRDTHRDLQQPSADPAMQQKNLRKLADAESGLSQAARHLYTQMSEEMENMPVGAAQDQLAKAEKSLESAAAALRENAIKEAPDREREGLADLVAARKIFQKALSENPDDFGSKPTTPLVTAEKDVLKQIAEFRNESKTVQESLQDAVTKQRAIAAEARKPSTAGSFARSLKQKDLQNQVEKLTKDHPQAMKGLEKQAASACQSMGQAAEDLAHSPGHAGESTQEAADELEQLRQAQQVQTDGQQLADAYKLKGVVDKEIQKMEQVQNSPGDFSSSDMNQMAEQSRDALQQMKDVTQQQPGAGSFGQPLKDALGESKMNLTNRILDALGKAETNPAKKTGAGEAREALKAVSQAFEKSAPQPLQMARRSDPLKPSGQAAGERGISELESLLQRMQDEKPASEENTRRQAGEAIANLAEAMHHPEGGDNRGDALIAELRDKFKGENPIDIDDLRHLISQLRNISVELAGNSRKPEKPEATSIDPAAMPPIYRGRIQKYFQMLSEKEK